MPGVYLSYPFCAQKCTYCNFASGVQPAALEAQYREALASEIRAHQWMWIPDTVYWGGGTPSSMAPAAFESLMQELPGMPWKEATIEAAPGGISRELAAAWVRAGINRVSLGVQSFSTAELRRTGRKHTAEIVATETRILRDCGIRSLNIDLIAGLSGQNEASWRDSLDWIERLQPEHVSVYMLEIDEDSRLGREILLGGQRFGAFDRPDEEETAEFYEIAVERLAAMGIARYEISNFARSGHESLHNLKYWQLAPYAGFGSDAHSFDGRQRTNNIEDAAGYVSNWLRGESVAAGTEDANPGEERFFVGLRLTAGIDVTAEDWSRLGDRFRRLIEAGLLESIGSRIRLTNRGVLLSNEAFQEFLER